VTDQSIAGSYALVTGASSGIGQAVAVALADHGVNVLVVGRNPARTRAVLTTLAVSGTHHMEVCGDLTSATFIAQLAEQALAWSSNQLSILIQCAGYHAPARIEHTPIVSLDEAIAVNLRAPFLLTAALLPTLRASRGYVAFINSSVVMHPRAETAAYAASKAGLRAFADCLRAEVSGEGVRVLSLFPGRTATPMQQARYVADGLTYRPERLLQPDEIALTILNAIRAPSEITELHLRPPFKD
jgi:short-subunit dehydrogenase